MDKTEIRAIIMDCLAEYGVAKAIRPKPRPKPSRPTFYKPDMDVCYDTWVAQFGPVNYGRFAKAFAPVLHTMEARWVIEGIKSYGKRAHLDGKPQYYTPEKFVAASQHYILPCLPSNELTEAEAELLGPEMVASRFHAATLGLLSERARG